MHCLWLAPIARLPLMRVCLRCRSSAGGGDEAAKQMFHFISFRLSKKSVKSAVFIHCFDWLAHLLFSSVLVRCCPSPFLIGCIVHRLQLRSSLSFGQSRMFWLLSGRSAAITLFLWRLHPQPKSSTRNNYPSMPWASRSPRINPPAAVAEISFLL